MTDPWTTCPCATCAARREPSGLVDKLRAEIRELHKRARRSEDEVAIWRSREAERLERLRRFDEWVVSGAPDDGVVQA